MSFYSFLRAGTKKKKKNFFFFFFFLFFFLWKKKKKIFFFPRAIFFINCLFVSFLCVLLQPQQRKRETRYEETSYKEFPAAAQMPYQLNPSSTCQLNSRQLKNNQ